MKSVASVAILALAVGIGSFLYLTLDTDFEAQPRASLRSAGSPLHFPIDEIKQIMNTAREAWSIVDKK